MTSKRSRATASAAPGRTGAEQRTDDLKQIRGVGPAAERRLHKAGIRTFAQLAALSPDRLAALAVGLSARRIAQENWIGQARQLAHLQARTPARKSAAKKTSTRSRKSATPHIVRQHYATFTVELLLDESNDVRRTRCVHIQSGERDTWAGWTEARLVSFVVKHAGLRVPGVPTPGPPTQPEAALPATMIAQPILPPVPEAGLAPVQALEVEARHGVTGGEEETLPRQVEALRGPLAAPITSAQGDARRPAETFQGEAESTHLAQGGREQLGGVLRLFEFAVMSTDSDQPRHMLPAGALFRVRLSLDLTNVAGSPDVPLDCVTSVYAKRLGGGKRQIFGEAHAAIKLSDKVTVEIGGLTLSPGLYRLEASVRINLLTLRSQAPTGLTAMSDGGLLQIY
jgi:hypothetical protein